MSMFASKRMRFETVGKDKLQIVVDSITGFEEGPYVIATGIYTEVDGAIEGGYSLTMSGTIGKYWRNDEIVIAEALRVYLKFNSNPVRNRLEEGVIGGGLFESKNHLEIEINVEPWCVKDILDELRRDADKGFRVDGYAISDKVFRVAYFQLFPAQRGSRVRR